MSEAKGYVLDANVFIQAHRHYYDFTVCPGFWQALLALHDAKHVFSIDKVMNEILDGDALSDWAKNSCPKEFFRRTADIAVINAFKEMVQWVSGEQQFNNNAKSGIQQRGRRLGCCLC